MKLAIASATGVWLTINWVYWLSVEFYCRVHSSIETVSFCWSCARQSVICSRGGRTSPFSSFSSLWCIFCCSEMGYIAMLNVSELYLCTHVHTYVCTYVRMIGTYTLWRGPAVQYMLSGYCCWMKSTAGMYVLYVRKFRAVEKCLLHWWSTLWIVGVLVSVWLEVDVTGGNLSWDCRLGKELGS